MTVWVNRVGEFGEYEADFLENSHVAVSYKCKKDIAKFTSRDDLKSAHPSGADTLWRFYDKVEQDDIVVVPFKNQPVVWIGRIAGPYAYRPSDPYHIRPVQWMAKEIPRTSFDSELLPSLSGHKACYGIRRDDAEERVEALVARWQKEPEAATSEGSEDPDSEDDIPNLEKLGRDLIARMIITRFKGHGLARLAGALLESQGYTIFVSPPGPDGGIDIRAAGGALGLGAPRICVQVKSGETPTGGPEIQQLMGSMATAGAEHGVFLSWSGFKQGVEKAWAKEYFRVRFWDQRSFVDELLDHYEKLDSEIKAELPLKQIWTVVQPE